MIFSSTIFFLTNPYNLGTVVGMNTVPTVTDNLFSAKIIPTESIGISYVPTTSAANLANGEMTFGATDPAKYACQSSFDFAIHSHACQIYRLN
jgi:hypothetical protein